MRTPVFIFVLTSGDQVERSLRRSPGRTGTDHVLSNKDQNIKISPDTGIWTVALRHALCDLYILTTDLTSQTKSLTNL